MFDTLSKHLGIASALTTAAAALAAMSFLFSYLSPFDLSLIWIIEYSDIFKFGLIAIGLLSGIMVFVFPFVIDFIEEQSKAGKHKVRFLIVLFVFLAICLAISLYVDMYKTTSPAKEFHISLALTIFLAALLIFGVTKQYAFYKRIEGPFSVNFWLLIRSLALLIVFIFISGRTIGLAVRDVIGPTHTITFSIESGLKEVTGAKIVMAMSHHTIYQNREGLVVVPTDLIIKIKTTEECNCTTAPVTNQQSNLPILKSP